MEIADHEIAVATRDDIPGIVDLQGLRLVFRIEHGCGPRQMEKCVRYSEWTFLA